MKRRAAARLLSAVFCVELFAALPGAARALTPVEEEPMIPVEVLEAALSEPAEDAAEPSADAAEASEDAEAVEEAAASEAAEDGTAEPSEASAGKPWYYDGARFSLSYGLLAPEDVLDPGWEEPLSAREFGAALLALRGEGEDAVPAGLVDAAEDAVLTRKAFITALWQFALSRNPDLERYAEPLPPEEPDAPETTEEPNTPETSAEPDAPEEPTAPDVTEAEPPEESDAPEAVETPVEPDATEAETPGAAEADDGAELAARSAMRWAVAEGVLRGDGGELFLQEPVTRAQAAVMLCRARGVLWDAAETAREILDGLTLRQKLGQMIMPAFRYWKADAAQTGNGEPVTELNAQQREAVARYGFGGVILFAQNAPDAARTRNLTRQFQQAAASGGGLPLLIGIDQEGGSITRLGTGTAMPGNLLLGAADDPAVTREAYRVTGAELAALGIQLDFAPAADVNGEPSNPIIGLRAFSDDPERTAAHVVPAIEGLHREGIATAVKHFPGHGDTATDSHTGLPRIERGLDELEAVDLLPFRAAVAAGTDMVMTAHIQYPAVEGEGWTSASTGEPVNLPATLSRTMITGLLRERLGFRGVVCTDALNMDAVAAHFRPEDAARLAVNAGADILLMPVEMSAPEGIEAMGAYLDALEGMVERGEIAAETVDAAVMRILTLKARRGLLTALPPDEPDTVPTDNPETVPADSPETASADTPDVPETAPADAPETAPVETPETLSVGSPEHHAIEWNLTLRGITLVKNENGAFPVKVQAGETYLLFYPRASEAEAVAYAVRRCRGAGLIPEESTVSALCYAGKTPDAFAAALAKADGAAVVTELSAGGTLDPERGLQPAMVRGVSAALRARGKPVAVISAGLPYDIAAYDQYADAVLACYGNRVMPRAPDEDGAADAERAGTFPAYGPNLPAALCVLFGEAEPAGTLPVTIPRLDSGYRYTRAALYPVGTGILPADEAGT